MQSKNSVFILLIVIELLTIKEKFIIKYVQLILHPVETIYSFIALLAQFIRFQDCL